MNLELANNFNKSNLRWLYYRNETSCPVEDGPHPECHFLPDNPQPETVHSSLLTHYHYLMDSFCTETTHKSNIPTPHNYFCGGKSAWEVFQGSDDFQAVRQPLDRPGVVFNTVKTSGLPLLHFILDTRIVHQVCTYSFVYTECTSVYTLKRVVNCDVILTFNLQMPENMLRLIKAALRTLFDFGIGVNEESLAAVTVFPGADDNSMLENIIPWTILDNARNDFQL